MLRLRLSADLPAHQAARATRRRPAPLDWGGEGAGWLKVLDETLLGPATTTSCGDEITIADYLGVAMVSLGEVIGMRLRAYPNIERWLGNMKARPELGARCNEVFYGYVVAPTRDKSFAAL